METVTTDSIATIPIATTDSIATESLETAAARQMKQLDLTTEKNGKKRSASVSRTAISPTVSNASSTPDELGKKLPMNRITVGNAPSPQISKATSKIGSLANSKYKPKETKVKIEHKKCEWNAKSKVGSLGNLSHVPSASGVKITTQKVEIRASSRIGSLANVTYTPGGGGKKIFDDKDYLRQKKSAVSKATDDNPPARSSRSSSLQRE